MIKPIVYNTLKEILPDLPLHLEYPANEKHGDYALTSAFALARVEKRNPLEIANEIARKISSPLFSKVEVMPPGFVNLFLSPEFLYTSLQKMNVDKLTSPRPKREKVLIEFVSVNPTGPCNVVSARAGAVGDSLVRIFRFLGDDVRSEFYVCDTGGQIESLGQSLLARVEELNGAPFLPPPDGYVGEYLIPIAKEFVASGLRKDVATASRYSVEQIVKQQKETLKKFRIVFDRWFYEHEIYEKKLDERVIHILKTKNLLFEQEGALWFKSTAFGDTRDRVIQTRNGKHTYLLPDIAYHWDKFDRGFDRLLTLLGPDHQGHVPSLKSGVKAIGLPVDKLDVMIVQQVNLVKGEKILPMSKRGGVFVTLDELMDKIPVDVIRFFFLMRTPSQPLDFDIELALTETEENPVYYIQYAHARIASIINFAQKKKIPAGDDPNLKLLTEPETLRLVKQILIFHEIIEHCWSTLEPHHLVYYLLELANRFHYFYQKHQVVSDRVEISRARLFLVNKVKEVIRCGLDLLGITSPDKM
ncbi:MAG: arginine--tRNA ligase [candidate division WOR-3 bacterium]